MIFYLLAALTGLSWSYEWYNKGLQKLFSDSPNSQQRKGGRGQPGPAGPAPVADYDAIWATIQQAAGPQLSLYNVRMPPVAGQPATVFYLRSDSPHERAFNQIVLDPVSGAIKKHERYADKSYKAQLLTSIYALHVGSYWAFRAHSGDHRQPLHAVVLHHRLVAVPGPTS